jgi:PHP family Zn ribbon phosphoesterase
MIPPLVVRQALEQNIHLIAITDHNHTANIQAVQKAAAGTPLTVLPGMELQTREEIHVLCLFDTLAQAATMQAYVDERLPQVDNKPDYFGEQFVVDETGDFIRREERLLLNSVQVDLDEAAEFVHSLGGLFIPAHVDRRMYGMLQVLGLPPDNLDADAYELSRHIEPAVALQRYPGLGRLPLLIGGDAHGLDGFLGANQFRLGSASIQEIRMALLGLQGRSYEIIPKCVPNS